MSTATAVEERAEELAALMTEVVGCDVAKAPAGVDTPLRSLEFESLRFVAFLVEIEERYEFEWDLDLTPEEISTIRKIAELVVDAEGRGRS